MILVIDCTRAGEGEATEFWRGMNFLREAWDALRAHIVFLLTPRNYRLLLNVADHLADWMPLRFHFMGLEADGYPGRMANDIPSMAGMLSPPVARERLAQLEKDLAAALASGAEKAALARRYYLPMLQSAVSLGDLHRAAALAGHIDAPDLADADRPAWLLASTILFLGRFQLAKATEQASPLLADAQSKGDATSEAQAAHLLGIIAQEQRDFAAAEQWYRKSLAIKEKHGNERGAASTYGQLGILAGLQGAYEESARWLIRCIKAFAARNNPHHAAQATSNFAIFLSEADEPTQRKMAAMWQEAGLGPLPKAPA